MRKLTKESSCCKKNNLSQSSQSVHVIESNVTDLVDLPAEDGAPAGDWVKPTAPGGGGADAVTYPLQALIPGYGGGISVIYTEFAVTTKNK